MLGTSDLAVAAAAASVPGIKLNDGNVIPQIGLGLLRIENDDVAPVVKSALAAGYRHIDGAAGYNNEGGVGRALAETGFNKGRKRSHLWVTTKLRDEGRVKTLGVCNFLPEHLTRLYEETGEWPAVNQIELHPTWQQREVVAFCKEHGIAVEAYSPMARGVDLKAGNGTIARIAEAHEVSPAQVLLRWHIENGTIIIPKAVPSERQRQNLDLFGFALTLDEHAAIDALDGPERAGHDPRTFSYA